MKNELKISTLSIVCALCAASVTPAFAASSVRSLGGAGTYQSASSAASAKTSGDSKAINSVRGGSMRVSNNASGKTATSATRTSSSRAATTPRLSIGKYLAGSSAMGGGSSAKPIDPGQSDVSGNIHTRVEALEQFMGYKEGGDNIPEQLNDIRNDIRIKTEELAADIADLTGVATSVSYENGVLKIAQGETVNEYDLNKEFATFKDLEDAINEIELKIPTKLSQLENDAGFITLAQIPAIPDVSGLATNAQLQAAAETLQAAINGKQAAGDYADLKDLEDLAARVDALTGTDTTTVAELAQLKTDVAQLKSDAENYADAAVLELVSDALEVVVNDYITSEKLETALSEYYTQEEVKALIDAARFDTGTLQNYYTKGETDALLDAKADKSALDDLTASVGDLVDAVEDKADATTVNQLTQIVNNKADTTTVNQLTEIVNNKADTTTVNELTEIVNNKADKTTVNNLTEDVTNLTENYSTLNESVTDLSSDLTTVTESVLVNQENIQNLNTTIASKADSATVNQLSQTVNNLNESVENMGDTYVATDDLADTVNQLFVDKQIEIPAGSIQNLHLADGSVTTVKLADKSVTPAKLNVDDMDEGAMAMVYVGPNGVAQWIDVELAYPVTDEEGQI